MPYHAVSDNKPASFWQRNSEKSPVICESKPSDRLKDGIKSKYDSNCQELTVILVYDILCPGSAQANDFDFQV